jgi:hypothetical protein
MKHALIKFKFLILDFIYIFLGSGVKVTLSKFYDQKITSKSIFIIISSFYFLFFYKHILIN